MPAIETLPSTAILYADRLAYRSELLRRLLFIDKGVARSTMDTIALENEMEVTLNAAEDASDLLRQLGRARFAR